ncbi:hypothetical protein AB6N24_06995 [Cellulomonas sp. 179-A 4D5 NHS]|uniref:hypothetical protein n=1 Tax=Cellulomonas sp. 179-A 4D5 NHS TaxID=3142378 RepID=UPI0039A14855
MQWDDETITDVVRAYRTNYELGQGDRQERAEAAERHFWAWETVNGAVGEGTLPVEVIDAMLHDPSGDDGYRSYVAAGPIEDMLRRQPERYTDEVAARCRVDAVWAETVDGVWLDRRTWEALPEPLRELIIEPQLRVQAERTRVRTGRRPSKRPSRRGRGH